MFRLFLLFPLFFSFSFSWSCMLCKQPKDCLDPSGYGLTEIRLYVPTSHDLKLKEHPSLHIFFSGKGNTLECKSQGSSIIKNCTGTIHDKTITIQQRNIGENQEIEVTASFFYKELYFFIQYNGVTLFDGTIDFDKKPNRWSKGVLSESCTACVNDGVAYITSNIVD